MSQSKVICFDIGGTLFDSGPSFAASIQQIAGRCLLREEWNKYFNLAVGPVEQDLSRLAAHLDLSLDQLFCVYMSHHSYPSRLFSDTIPTLRSLTRYRCVALSNAPHWLVSENLGGAEVYLNQVFYSHKIGYAKPDPESFKFVERALKVRGEDILMVGDSLTYDYEGALGAGWQALLLDRENRLSSNSSVARIRGLGGLIEHLAQVAKVPDGIKRSQEIEIKAKIERSGSTAFVSVPATFLSNEYTARPVRVRSDTGICRARVFRSYSGHVLLALGIKQCVSLGLAQSKREVRLRIEVIAEKLQLSPPPDLELALRNADLLWESIPERDRHLTVGLIREAKTPDLRKARIKRIVAALNGEET